MGDFMFERIVDLIGKEKFDLLQKKKILIVGIGGVGGYAFETLVRSGINNIDIIDFDKIEITNLNRQIISNINNINNYKVDEAKKRALTINPNINMNIFQTFLNKDNIDEILSNNYDYIVDACDSIDTKIELILKNEEYNYKLISSMGTAKKINPTKLTITTLDKTSYDPLAKVIRKKLRDLNYKKKVKVVSSTEQIIESNNLGSFMMVPATAGILLAQYVINDILENK